MKDFYLFLVFLISLSGLLGICAGVAYVSDPGGLFKPSYYEKEGINLLLSGYNITNFYPDEGRFRPDFIELDPVKRDTIVIGSSRTFEISNPVLDPLDLPFNRKFMNSHVTGGYIGDHIAVVECYAKRGTCPGRLLWRSGRTCFQIRGK